MKQAYVDDCPYYLDDFLTNMKVVKDRSDRTEEAYFIDIRTFLRYLNVKHHAVPAETPFNKIKIKKRLKVKMNWCIVVSVCIQRMWNI